MSSGRTPATTRSARLACVALVVLALAVLGGYWASRIASFAGLEQATLADLERRAAALTTALAEQTRGIFYGLDLVLLHLQHQYREKGELTEADAVAVRTATPPGLVRRVSVVGPDGRLAYTHPAIEGAAQLPVADREYFRVHLGSHDSGLYIGHPVRSRLDDDWLIPVSRALRDGDGRLLGVVLLVVAPQYFAETYQQLAAGNDDVFALVHRDGSFMARSVKPDEAYGRKVRVDRPFLDDAAPVAGIYRGASTIEPVERVFAYRRLGQWPLVVVNGLGIGEALTPVRAERVREMVAAALVSVLVLSLVAGVCVVVLRLGRNLVLLTEAEERLEQAFSGASELVWEWDLHERRLRFFGDCRSLIGDEGSDASLAVTAWVERIHGEDRAAVLAGTADHLRRKTLRLELQFRLRVADGSWHWVLSRGRVVEHDARGRARRMIGVLMDIDVSRKAEILAARTRESYARLIENAGEGIFVVDAEGRVEIFNPAAERLLGWRADEVRGRSAHELFHCQAEGEAAGAAAPLLATLADGLPRRGLRAAYRARDGREVPVELSIAPIRQEGAPTSAVVIVAGIAERLAWEAELERLARTDTLTGVNNRRYFVELVEREIQRAEREGSPLSLLMLDLDHFKAVNDRHGHAAGDALLIAAARVCVEELRQIDYFGRLGGEEFGVVLPGVDLADALLVADRLREQIARAAVVVDGVSIGCTASIGVAERRRGERFDALLARADNRLYGAKDSGRNRVVADLPGPG